MGDNKKRKSSKQSKSNREELQMIFGRLMQEKSESSKNRICSYWNTLSFELKKELLMIGVEDLKLHFKSSDSYLDDFLSFAVTCGKSLKAWICFPCGEGFTKAESYRKHIGQEHVENLLSEREFFPEDVEKEWIENIQSCSWTPLDASAARKMLENDTKSEEASTTEAYSLAGCPLSNDTERATLLKKIQEGLDVLISNKYLTTSHLRQVIKLAKDEIWRLAFGSQILNHALDYQSLNFICLLAVPELSKIYQFLLELDHACALMMNANKNTDPTDDLHNSNQISEIQEIRISEDASCFLLDECLVPAPGATESAEMDDVINNIDPFLSWIFSGSCGEEWNFWEATKEDIANQESEFVEDLEKLFDQVREYCKEKRELMKYGKVLNVVWNLCLEEDKKENLTESVWQRYESVLRLRHEELISSEEHVNDTSELKAITFVLEVAQVTKANEFVLEFQMDNCIKTAIQILKGNQSNELCKIDGAIMRSVGEIERLQQKLKCVPALDFRLMILPLLKTYLKNRLDDLSREALEAEHTAESRKGVKGGSYNRNKDDRKTRDLNIGSITIDLKAIYGDEQHVQNTTTADSHSSAVHDIKKRLAERLIEIEAKKKSLAEQMKELKEVKEVRVTAEIEDMKEKVAKKQKHLTLQEVELRDEEGRLRVEIEENKAKTTRKQRQLAQQEKQLRDEEEKLRIEIQEKQAKLAQKRAQIAQQQKQLGDEKERLRMDIQEKEAKFAKKRMQIAQQKKELGEEEEWLGYEIEEKRAKLAEKGTHIANQLKELEEEEQMIKNQLEKQDEEVVHPIAQVLKI